LKPLYILAFSFFYGTHCFAQLGGKHVYEFLSMPASARITGLGGQVIGVMDDDVSLALGNPASLNDRMHNHLSFAPVSYTHLRAYPLHMTSFLKAYKTDMSAMPENGTSGI